MKDALKRLEDASRRLDAAMRQASSLRDESFVREQSSSVSARRTDVTRDEFNRVIQILLDRTEILEGFRRDLRIQFQRTAQLQVAVDRLVARLDALENANAQNARREAPAAKKR